MHSRGAYLSSATSDGFDLVKSNVVKHIKNLKSKKEPVQLLQILREFSAFFLFKNPNVYALKNVIHPASGRAAGRCRCETSLIMTGLMTRPGHTAVREYYCSMYCTAVSTVVRLGCGMNSELKVPRLGLKSDHQAAQLVLPDDHSVEDIGSRVWDGALSLLQHMLLHRSAALQGARVIELGAGVGFLGIACFLHGARQVCITDLPPIVARIQDNIDLNRGAIDALTPAMNGSPHAESGVMARALPWGSDVSSFEPPFDAIIASDVAYEQAAVVLLLTSLFELSSPDSLILVACKARSGLHEFVQSADALFVVADDDAPTASAATLSATRASHGAAAIRIIRLVKRASACLDDLHVIAARAAAAKDMRLAALRGEFLSSLDDSVAGLFADPE
jgi:predicted nicotinamide N-methyase